MDMGFGWDKKYPKKEKNQCLVINKSTGDFRNITCTGKKEFICETRGLPIEIDPKLGKGGSIV